MFGSSSFDADDIHPRHRRVDDRTTPSTHGLSASKLSTPIMTQQNTLALFLNTPPANNGCHDENSTASLTNDFNTENEPSNTTTLPLFPSDHTPSPFSSQYDNLEPPAWKPPEAEEVEYTDAWNIIYNNQHHFLQPDFTHDDSTIGSSQTNNSMTNNISVNSSNLLRPRGESLCSYADDPSTVSCPQPEQRGQHAQHRRHTSLPVVPSFSSITQLSSHQQPFPAQRQQGNQNHPTTSKQYLNLLQSTTESIPYELHSHQNVSQVQADGAMAGLDGILLDLYAVDRSVDSATAKMLSTKEEDGVSGASENGNGDTISRKKGASKWSSQKPRKTSVGTLSDVQRILELHKVDTIVDRFKHDLQMPEFSEEEACESNLWKDLRETDVEMEEYSRKKKSKEIDEMQQREGCDGRGMKENIQYQFDVTDTAEEVRWNNGQKELGGKDIYLSAESHLTDCDAYRFFDPHETDALQANSYRPSQVSASINDDLHEIIDLLRVDAEVDGASKHQIEMAMVRPFLEIDQEMNRRKARLKVRDMWDGELRPLYLTDLDVDGAAIKHASKPQKVNVEVGNISADLEIKASSVDEAKRKCAPKPQTAKAEHTSDGWEAKASSFDTIKQQDPTFPVHTASSSTDQEVKDMLSQHIPQVSQPFCPTSPELIPSRVMIQAADLTLPPTAPMPPLQLTTRRVIGSTLENSSANSMPKAASTRRSIFSRQEKSSAKTQCAFQRGVMMPGTTTIVMAKGGEMIDDIPVGRVVLTNASEGANIR